MTERPGPAAIESAERSIDRPGALARRYGNQAGSRAYDLFVPSGSGHGPRPLLVMLHGCSQTARDFAIGTRMDRLAEEQGVIVAYPDQPRSANMLKSWNWFRDSDQHRGRGEPSILAGLTRRIMEDLDVDPARVYVAGLSSGGAAAAVMAQAYPDIYAAVGIHSGLASGAAVSMAAALSTMRRGAVRQPLRTAHPVPTIVFHGDRDTTVASINGDQAIAQSRPGTELTGTTTEGRSAAGRSFTRTVLAETYGAWSSEQWLLHGAGHAWAGGHPSGSHTDPQGPDASREMLRFFMSHAMGARLHMT
ncbi:PHB depolymerase family esterase [Methylobacterium sp. WL6]|uniref:extracellular catalytic domain type 1 short-chain-length polyhydroxyalkanoate depolymerase n=1 Tax=Methylobacterium sp. WL6 TaxID=2603901 RepID=UPI0011CAD88E|nr:PHB depolymerase family esterase [Methylobacterium sp. WL6]TXN72324.1 PHB depolymerase family esterase [Methylobacterium sp. WL6]